MQIISTLQTRVYNNLLFVSLNLEEALLILTTSGKNTAVNLFSSGIP